MTISFVPIFTFVWILENKSREPLKTRQYVTAETLTWDMWKQNVSMIFRRFLKNIYAKWIQFITFTAGLGSL